MGDCSTTGTARQASGVIARFIYDASPGLGELEPGDRAALRTS